MLSRYPTGVIWLQGIDIFGCLGQITRAEPVGIAIEKCNWCHFVTNPRAHPIEPTVSVVHVAPVRSGGVKHVLLHKMTLP